MTNKFGSESQLCELTLLLRYFSFLKDSDKTYVMEEWEIKGGYLCVSTMLPEAQECSTHGKLIFFLLLFSFPLSASSDTFAEKERRQVIGDGDLLKMIYL